MLSIILLNKQRMSINHGKIVDQYEPE